MLILDETKSTVVCTEGRFADTLPTRLFGLLGRKGMEPGEGLLITPSSGVHTFGMSFAIDIVAMDQEQCVLGVWSEVAAWKIRGVSWKTRRVLELSAGESRRPKIAIGDELEFHEK